MKYERVTAKPVIVSLLLFFTVSLQAFALQEAPPPKVQTYDELLHAIRATRAASQARIETAVEQEKVREAWETGKLIDEHILLHKERAGYGERVITRLAKDLGKSETDLRYMLQFARTYPIHQPADELTWSHYMELLSLNDSKEREEITRQAVENGWGRDRLREEVRRRRSHSEAKAEPLHAVPPGKDRAWRVVLAVDGPYRKRLALDLGFADFFRPENFSGFEPGAIVRIEKGKFKRAGTDGEKDLFAYEAYVRHIVAGDTFFAMIDLGFGITTVQKLRLRGLDAPEIFPHEMSKSRREALGSPETSVKSAGLEAKAFLERQFADTGGRILIRTVKSDKYDRYLADVWAGESYLNQKLIDAGLAIRVSE